MRSTNTDTDTNSKVPILPRSSLIITQKPNPKLSPKPFQRALHLSNLPPSIKASHFQYILSHPVHSSSKHKRTKRDSGISMIQIYHIPFVHPKSTLEVIRNFLKRIYCSPKDENNDPHTVEPSCIIRKPMEEDQGVIGTVEEREVNENEDDSPEVSLDELVVTGKAEQGEKVDTVAWIHFRNEDQLYRAKDVFNSITIDGRRITVKVDRFNPGLFKRMLNPIIDRKTTN
ncbi:uncharacterized protein IL334_007380 [Kwoniella shivajii]|uniref:RRM domain-containing protein n=1 Tax=Kwoniella shivajii TaxID=564305 RepID=A0ABZ1D9W7_9TREE|nr:hypothetical protein IL334_007380 [Kwoniella shivajii]